MHGHHLDHSPTHHLHPPPTVQVKVASDTEEKVPTSCFFSATTRAARRSINSFAAILAGFNSPPASQRQIDQANGRGPSHHVAHKHCPTIRIRSRLRSSAPCRTVHDSNITGTLPPTITCCSPDPSAGSVRSTRRGELKNSITVSAGEYNSPHFLHRFGVTRTTSVGDFHLCTQR